MAATTFKQQCPSCEAMVPIKDAGLVGKKIDCPKCKYRFVVEAAPDAPEEEEVEEEKPAKKGKAKAEKKKAEDDYEEDEEGLGRSRRKKKQGGNTKMIVGVVLAIVAVGILGVAGVLMFGGGDSKPSSAASGGGGGGASMPSTPAAAATQVAGESSKEDEKPAAAAPATVLVDPRNLLLPDSKVVLHVAVQDTVKSSLGKLNYYLSSSLNPQTYERNFGIGSPEDIERIVMAGSDRWGAFIVVRTAKPINSAVFKKAMNLKSGGQPIRGQEFFTLDPIAFIKASGMLSPAQLTLLNATPKHEDQLLAVRFHDDKTLVMANMPAMKLFLEAGGSPTAAAEDSPAGGGRGGRGGPAMGMGGPMAGAAGGPIMPGGGGMNNKREMMMEQMGGAPGGQQGSRPAPSAAAGYYTTLGTRLRTMMQSLEAKPVLLSFGADVDAQFENVNRMSGNVVPAPVSTLGASIQAAEGIGLVAAVEGRTEQNTQALLRQLDALTDMLKGMLESKLDVAINWTKPDPNSAGGGPIMPGGMGGGGGEDGTQGGMSMRQGMMMQQQMMRRGSMGMPGGTLPGQGTMPVPAEPERPKIDKPTFGTLSIDGPRMENRTLLVTMKVDREAWDHLIGTYAAPYFLREKGKVDMAMTQPRPHELGQRLREYSEKNQKFPRGTFDRTLSVDRMHRPWQPDEKVSWMADLLPYLPGHADVHAQINFQKSWRDKENLDAAMTLVPYFLDRNSPPSSWYVTHPGLTGEVAATHYVGVAGVGMDSADYPIQSPEFAKRRGVFGYDRETQLSDIGDLAYTVVLLQVPPSLRGAWLAGGGSTVRGVPETKSVQPFVCASGPGGKRGTMAVMADGSVRFIAEDVNDKVFQALCVVDKNKPRQGMDELPIVPNEQPVPKAGVVGFSIPAAPEAPKPADKPAPSSLLGNIQAAAQRQATSNDLKQIALAYHNYVDKTKQPPSKLEDLQKVGFDKEAAPVYKAAQEGKYVVFWNADFKTMTQGTSNTVLAYEKDAPAKGGAVAMADGSVKTMTADEFGKATKAGGK